METRTPRPKPKIDFTVDALDFKNTNLLRQFVTDQGRILPRKYTGHARALPAPPDPRHQARAPDAADEVNFRTRLQPQSVTRFCFAGNRLQTICNCLILRTAGVIFEAS